MGQLLNTLMANVIPEPIEKNLLGNGGYRFVIERLPGVSYFGQKLSIPSISVSAKNFSTPFLDVPLPDVKISFGLFSVSFVVDVDLTNYLEVYEWINDLGRPNEFDGRETVLRQANSLRAVSTGFYSDGFVTLYDADLNAKVKVVFEDLWPTYLGELAVEATDAGLTYVSCDVKFQYTLFDIEIL